MPSLFGVLTPLAGCLECTAEQGELAAIVAVIEA